MENIDPETNSDIEASVLMTDKDGQVRLHMVTSEGNRIVGFRKTGEKGLPKIITIIPGQDRQSVEKAAQNEIQGDFKPRLNRMGEGIEQISINDYSKIIET